jgi:hypothetical protein
MITILDGTEAAPHGKSATHAHLYGPWIRNAVSRLNLFHFPPARGLSP